MKTLKLVLTEPFIRHPAGQVFELNEAQGLSGWDDDERAREKLNFSDKRYYSLPDGGNGLACELPAAATRICPEGVFDQVDLLSGPVRITQAPGDLKYTAELQAANGRQAQVLVFPERQLPEPIRDVKLYDKLREQQHPAPEWQGCALDFSAIPPGFYTLTLCFARAQEMPVQLIKSFPLLVLFSGGNSSFHVQKTLY